MNYLASPLAPNENQYDFWRDSAWQSIGGVAAMIGAVATIVSIYFIVRQVQKKSLSYEVINISEIMNVATEFKDKLEIRFNGIIVDKLTLVVLEFSNSGNVSIDQKDYSRPISVDFGDTSEILSVDIPSQKPSNLGIIFNHDKRLVSIEPLLMNKGDSFKIQALVSKYNGYSIDGRISGINQIERIDNQNNLRISIILVSANLYVVALTTLATLTSVGFGTTHLLIVTIAAAILAVAASLFVNLIPNSKKRIK